MMSNRLPTLAADIRKAHTDVQDAVKTATEGAIDAGHALIEAKELVKHGQWLPWLRENCAVPERTAQLYMRIANSGLKSATVADLGLQQSERIAGSAAKLDIDASFAERWLPLEYLNNLAAVANDLWPDAGRGRALYGRLNFDRFLAFSSRQDGSQYAHYEYVFLTHWVKQSHFGHSEKPMTKLGVAAAHVSAVQHIPIMSSEDMSAEEAEEWFSKYSSEAAA